MKSVRDIWIEIKALVAHNLKMGKTERCLLTLVHKFLPRACNLVQIWPSINHTGTRPGTADRPNVFRH